MNGVLLLAAMAIGVCSSLTAVEKPRVIVTGDGEIDDQCSMVRFLRYTNECDVEGKTIHRICEVTDAGVPPRTRYPRVVLMVKK